MLEIFQVPPDLNSELLLFFARQDCYSLDQLRQVKPELEQHVGIYVLYYCAANPLYASISRAKKLIYNQYLNHHFIEKDSSKFWTLWVKA